MPEVEWLGLCLNLPNLAPSQYAGWNFNSMCRFGDVYLGANSDGIYVLGEADDDDGEEIQAFFELPLLDLSMARIRSVHIGYETQGHLLVGVQADDGEMRYYLLAPVKPGLESHTKRVTVGRDKRGRYWLFRIENVNGVDFSVDSVEIYPIHLGRRNSAE